MREGKAKVLNDRELSRAVNTVKKKSHAKRNVALLYVSFGLGLRAKEMAALKLKHVLDADHMLLDEINLTGVRIPVIVTADSGPS
jgi:integrase/recombinase XerD